MHEQPEHFPEFKSSVGKLLSDFLSEKVACGYRYQSEKGILNRFDKFVLYKGMETCELPRTLIEEWVRKKAYESPTTQRIRFHVIRRFAEFMQQRGHNVFVPDSKTLPVKAVNFTPYIFSHDEIRRLFAAADSLEFNPISPLRPIIMPEFFRLLYACGLRVGEARRLTLADVNLEQGIITIRDSKFHKDRLVPLAPEVTIRLTHLKEALGDRIPNAYFFPAPDQGPYSSSMIYETFRFLLWKSRISHGGRGYGPRVHDLRHTFAVHRLATWYQEGVDLNAKLPVLATYMGHKCVVSTQQYLHLTIDLFAGLSTRLEKSFGHTIPRRGEI